MNALQERILRDGEIREGNVLKVDSFLNHQMDVALIDEIGKEFYRRFEGCGVNKILTIEASGIALACAAARYFNVPVVFAKKSKSVNIGNDVYLAEVASFTHKCVNNVVVSKRFLHPEDRLLIVDDFLAKGCALQGLLSISRDAGAEVVGIGIAIEKGFQGGGDALRREGYRLESLAIVDEMDPAAHALSFREE